MKNPQLVLSSLAVAMKNYPDLRVGQFLENAMTWYNANSKGARYMDRTGQPDLYFVEDHELANIISMFIVFLKKGEGYADQG